MKDKIAQLIEVLTKATLHNRVGWKASTYGDGGWETYVAEGRVVVHSPTHDQRNGDFAWVTVLDADGRQVERSSGGIGLQRLIVDTPKNNLLDGMITELGDKL